jgi:hypothetical protein
MTGAELDEQDKARIIGGVGSDPARIAVSASIDAAHVQFRNFGLAATMEYAVSFSLPGDILELALNGNELDRTYRLAGLGTDTLLLSRVTVATGWDVWAGLCVGAGLSWFHGFNRVQAAIVSGELTTAKGALWGHARQLTTVARGGDGMSLTAGCSGRLGDDMELGLCVRDMFAGIWWYRGTARRELSLKLDSVNLRLLQEHPVLDSFLTIDEVQRNTAGFWTALPGVLACAANWRRPGPVSLGLLVNVGFGLDAFLERPPLLGVRIDYALAQEVEMSFIAGAHHTGEWTFDYLLNGLFDAQLAGLGLTIWSAGMVPASFRIRFSFGAVLLPEPDVSGSAPTSFPGF